MKKTLTAALALSTFAGLALATSTIETQQAGCISIGVSAGGSAYVINPFDSFGSGLTLGDIDGADLNDEGCFIRVIDANGKKLFDAKWRDDEGYATGWWTWANSAYGVVTNSHSLNRGDSVMFLAGSNSAETLYVAGTINNAPKAISLLKNHNFVGNVAPVDKTLGLFTISGSKYDPFSSGYVLINGEKLVYLPQDIASMARLNAGWYLKSDLTGSNPGAASSRNSTVITKGTGFRVYFPQADGTASGVVLNCPGI